MLESKLHKLIQEAWSQKYKDSIDCSRPRGFSQRAHCQGKKKTNENLETSFLEDDIYEEFGVHVELHEIDDYLVLNRIFVPSDVRGVGLGSKALEAVTHFADMNGMDIFLTPSEMYGSKMSKLMNFYKKFGFKRKPRSDFRSKNLLMRPAKG